ncbi:hypothetical protein SUGI_0982560 [Cryptomeria japonica]|nr:hypothetical protein SUGI_0982560 [Cryptomeria japonica]
MGVSKSTRNYVLVSLILRIVTAAVLPLSITLMVTNKFKLNTEYTEDTEDKGTFKDVYAFRYLVLVSLIAFGYNVLQIILQIFFLITRRYLRPTFTLFFDFIADKVVAYCLASSASAALGVAFEARRGFHTFFIPILLLDDDNQDIKKVDKFFVKAETSAALALVATFTMILVSIISARFLFKNY